MLPIKEEGGNGGGDGDGENVGERKWDTALEMLQTIPLLLGLSQITMDLFLLLFFFFFLITDTRSKA